MNLAPECFRGFLFKGGSGKAGRFPGEVHAVLTAGRRHAATVRTAYRSVRTVGKRDQSKSASSGAMLNLPSLTLLHSRRILAMAS